MIRSPYDAAASTTLAFLAACQPGTPAKQTKPSQTTAQTPADAAKPDAQVSPAASATSFAPDRMDWWRDARFGMFIHWGIYSVPAGQWGKATGHAEWIRDTAKIPLEEYEKFRDQFNPVKFDANAWVAAAKAAGMRYICITTKHHDGFCLYDSKFTDWDVMSTPFKRDIMKEIAEACSKQGVTICWYHSIMDWHHPDYLPRRPWENRPTEGADFNRFNTYLKNQVGEILSNYGPIGVLWFDGQWEGTWTHERGLDLAAHVRKLQPNIIINNRVDKGGGSFGMTRGKEFAGDFGTPEQEIPPTGFPGVDWETCMTMNDHWGYNKFDHKFKTTEDLIRKLADIASKGGNFLLNVGPTAEGEIPATSLERMRDIAAWMKINGDSIHGTQAGPFETLAWGRCTQKALGNSKGPMQNRLFLHVFDWPKDGKLVVPGLFNDATAASLLADPSHPLKFTREADSLVIVLPAKAPDAIDSVVVLDVIGKPDVASAPKIEADSDFFVDTHVARITTSRENVELRYTTDGTDPTARSPLFKEAVALNQTSTIAARTFRGERAVSPVARKTFTKVQPRPALANKSVATTPGVSYQYFEGDWNKVPDFGAMKPKATGIVQAFDRKPRTREEYFGFRYTGFITIPTDGVYTFWTASDDGSNLLVDGEKVVDNDGLHSLQERSGAAALGKGLHQVMIDFFEKTGGQELDVWIAGGGMPRKKLQGSDLMTEKP